MYMSSSGANGLTPIWHYCCQVRAGHTQVLFRSDCFMEANNMNLEQTVPKVAEKIFRLLPT